MRLSVPAIAHTPAIDSAIRVLLFLVCYWPLAAPCRDCLLRPSLLTAALWRHSRALPVQFCAVCRTRRISSLPVQFCAHCRALLPHAF